MCIEEGGEWDSHLFAAVLGLNNKIHGVTRYSRFEMMYGRSPPTLSLDDEPEEDVIVDDNWANPAMQIEFLNRRSEALADVYAQASRNILKGQKKQRVGYAKRQDNK